MHALGGFVVGVLLTILLMPWWGGMMSRYGYGYNGMTQHGAQCGPTGCSLGE